MVVILAGISVIYLSTKLNVNKIENKFGNNPKLLFYVVAIVLSVIPAFRSIMETKVDDLINYRNLYLRLPFVSYDKLWTEYINEDLKDYGFSAASKVLADWGVSVETWMNIIGIIFAIPFTYFIYKYSKNMYTSSLMLLSLMFSFTLTGLRQTVALGGILLAYKWIIDKKPIKFIITVLIAACFHSTAILFLPAYWLAKLTVGIKQFVMIGISFVLSTVFPGVFRNLIVTFSWNEQMEMYAERTVGLTWSGFIINLLIYIFCFVFASKINIKSKLEREVYSKFMSLMAIGLMFLAISTVVAEAFRMSYYFNMCSVVVVANTVEDLKDEKDKKILKFVLPIVFVLYMLITSPYTGLIFI